MLTRFELAVVVRTQISDRRILVHYLEVEAAMEAVAEVMNVDRELAALAGFGAAIDAQLCGANPARRGWMAGELLDNEGAPGVVVNAVVSARHGAIDLVCPLGAALAVCEATVEGWRALQDEEPQYGVSRDDESCEPTSQGVTAWIQLAARREPSSVAGRAQAVCVRTDLALEEVVANALTGVRSITSSRSRTDTLA